MKFVGYNSATIIWTILEISVVTAISYRKTRDLQLNPFWTPDQSGGVLGGTQIEEHSSSPRPEIVFGTVRNRSRPDSRMVELNSDAKETATLLFSLPETNQTPSSYTYANILKGIQNEANVTLGDIPSPLDTLQTILATRWDRVLKRVLAQERLEVLFPRPFNLSETCYRDLMAFVGGLVGVNNAAGSLISEEWALQMLDSFGKPSAGLFKGVFQWVGNYEECLETRGKTEVGNNVTAEFGGKYCRLLVDVSHVIKVAFPMNINKFWLGDKSFPVVVNWGVCVPDSCNAADVVSFFTKGTMAAARLPVQKAVCFGGTRFSQDSAAVATVVILCIFVAVVTVCTALDIYYYRPWMSSDDRKDAGNVDVKEMDGGILEMQRRFDESSYRTDKPSFPSPSRGHASVTSVEQTELSGYSVKQETPEGVGNGSKTTACSKSEESSNRNGSAGQHSLDTKTKPAQSQTETAVPPGVASNPEKGTVEARSRVNAETNRSVKSVRKVMGEQLIQGMSFYRNLCGLVRKSRARGTFDCIQGMRVITLAWIVVGHCYTYGGMLDETNLIFGNSAELVETSARLSFHIVGSAHLAVDTFFVISGCLFMLVTLRLLRKNKPGLKFWTKFLLHRFWRLTPLYMIVLMVGTTLYDHVVQGPLKSDKLPEFEQCRVKWWSHLVYINNFYRPHSKCMTWSWFMAVDMQLFLISPIFIYTVHRNLKVGLVLIISLLVFGITSAFASEYVHGGQFVLMDLSFLDYWSYVYTMPWARASVFAIGLLLGVLVYKQVGRPVISKRTALCIWVAVAVVCTFLVLINHNQWKHDSQNWTRIQQSFYESLVRPAWAVCIAWVIFACCSDLGGFANTVLVWRPFLVLSRLTYSLYLLHPMVILFMVYSRRSTIYLDPANISLVYSYIGNLTISFLLSVILSVTFEMPLAAMENVLWRGL